ncbi:cytochrome b-c1 complex subunit 10-like [Euwallacea fornicatus]|uniref:cytochrome b-c1 complex subunit 10-like n=1 Tax=Euwallacea fornicatus TaxID=995702 RepID=UPI00338D4468
MSILRIISKKHMEITSQWLGSGAVYGATAGALLVYFTDWRVITDYLPFYNGKYVKDE